MKKHFVQIVAPGDEFNAKLEAWTEWRQCKTLQETALLAIHKWMRDSGYANALAEFTTFTVRVYVADETMPKHANGTFMTCHGFDMEVSKPKPRPTCDCHPVLTDDGVMHHEKCAS